MKLAIFGSSGFIGSHLVTFLEREGHEVLPFSRREKAKYFWDPEKKIIELSLLEGIDVIINLAGDNIFGRWNQEKKKKIRDSRINSTQFLIETIQKLKTPPKLYMGASAIGFYGDRGIEVITEESDRGAGFLADICVEIETMVKVLKIRVAMLRFGVVLGKNGGALSKMEPVFKMGLGGNLGHGCQIMSWIELEDALRAIWFIIGNETLDGPINLVSPLPVTNNDMTKILARILHRPVLFSVPQFMLKIIFNEGADIYLMSTYVIGKKLKEANFKFKYPRLEEALLKNL